MVTKVTNKKYYLVYYQWICDKKCCIHFWNLMHLEMTFDANPSDSLKIKAHLDIKKNFFFLAFVLVIMDATTLLVLLPLIYTLITSVYYLVNSLHCCLNNAPDISQSFISEFWLVVRYVQRCRSESRSTTMDCNWYM
eukprot:433033_1